MKLDFCWFLPLPAAVIANARGLYEAEGLQVAATNIRSSDEQYQLLEAGQADAAVTAMDNVLEWNLRGAVDDLRVMAQVEKTTNSVLMGAPGIRSMNDIKGGKLIVDAPGNGFVVVTQALLRDAGVAPDDYQLSVVGGVMARVDALCQGEGDAALLVPLFEKRVLDAGGSVLGRVDDHYPEFPGQGLVSRSSRWDSLAPALSAWLDALRKASNWAEENVAEAVTIVEGETGLPASAVEGMLRAIPSSYRPRQQGLECVMSQRNALGMPGARGEVSRLFDPRLTEAD